MRTAAATYHPPRRLTHLRPSMEPTSAHDGFCNRNQGMLAYHEADDGQATRRPRCSAEA